MLINAFAESGAPMRFVGGSVRDALLGKAVKDVDVATSLVPDDVIKLLTKAGIKSIPTGIDHGTVTAVIDKKHFEITTLRKDVSTDGRWAEVAYTDDWKEDASRRDFTMNALYLSPQGEVFDYFGGAEDAKAGRVRFIGSAEKRIREDYLRILRFFRFHAWYGKSEPNREALAACRNEAANMAKLSGERIQQEMLKLLAAPHCHLTISLMQEYDVLPSLLGLNLRDTGMLSRFDKLQETESFPPALKLMGFMMSSDFPADAALDRLHEKLKLSKANTEILHRAFLHYDEIHPDLALAVQKKLIRRLKADHFRHVILTAWAHGNDFIAANHPYMNMLKLATEWQQPIFPVTGDDLIALGIKPGKGMGELLEGLDHLWEESDYKLSKAELLKRVQEKR
jgi:poly(A) polymerase